MVRSSPAPASLALLSRSPPGRSAVPLAAGPPLRRRLPSSLVPRSSVQAAPAASLAGRVCSWLAGMACSSAAAMATAIMAGSSPGQPHPARSSARGPRARSSPVARGRKLSQGIFFGTLFSIERAGLWIDQALRRGALRRAQRREGAGRGAQAFRRGGDETGLSRSTGPASTSTPWKTGVGGINSGYGGAVFACWELISRNRRNAGSHLWQIPAQGLSAIGEHSASVCVARAGASVFSASIGEISLWSVCHQVYCAGGSVGLMRSEHFPGRCQLLPLGGQSIQAAPHGAEQIARGAGLLQEVTVALGEGTRCSRPKPLRHIR